MGESRRDSTTRHCSFLEANFPLDARVAPVEVLYNSALSPLITLETAQQEKSVLLLSEKRLLFEGWKKVLLSLPKRIFMSIRNFFYKAWMHVYLIWSSKEMHLSSDVFSLSNTKHLCRNAVLHWDDDVASLPPHNLMMWWACHLRIWLNGLASSHV